MLNVCIRYLISVMFFLWQGSLLACEFLLQNGANVNHRDQHGQGALHAAATYGHTGYCDYENDFVHLRAQIHLLSK